MTTFREKVLALYHAKLRRTIWRIPFLRPIDRAITRYQIEQSSKKRDPEENAKSTPPDGEKLALQALWAVEFYTPSQIERLFDGFKRLGWDKADTLNKNPIEWITQNRSTMLGGGWFNLGGIRRERQNSAWSDARSAPLPEGVEYAQGGIFTLTSSLTCIAIMFVYTEEFSNRFDTALRTTRQTIARPSVGSGFSIASPRSQKEEDIRATRMLIRRDAWAWFKANLPGVFSEEAELPDDFPACELTTTKITQPFPAKGEVTPDSRGFLDTVGLNMAFDAWKTNGAPDLRFSSHWAREIGFHGVVSGKEPDIATYATAHHFGGDRAGWIYAVDMGLQRFITRWSIVALLSFLQRRVNSLRDTAIAKTAESNDSLAFLERLGDIESRGFDTATISLELQHFVKSGWFDHDVADFVPVEPSPFTGASLAKNLQRHITSQVRWLQRADEQVRRVLSQQGSLIATRENIRLQQRMETLTKWIAAFTVIAIIVAVVAAMETDADGKKLIAQFVGTVSATVGSVVRWVVHYIHK